MNKITVFYDHIRNAMKQENLTLEEVAAKLTAAGISGIETDYLDVAGEEGEALASKLSELGLPVSSVYCHFHWELDPPQEEIEAVLKQLQKVGIQNLLAIPGFMLEGQTSLESKEILCPYLSKLCEEAKAYGIQVLMEDFDGAAASFGTSDDLRWYMDRIPQLGCAFDTGNFLFFGENADEALPALEDKVAYVHCKDRSLEPKEGEEPLMAVTGTALYSSPVGHGVIKMREILEKILANGYEGPLAIEHFGSMHQLDDMLASAAFLRDFLQA